MDSEYSLTIENFYQFCAKGKLVGARCRSCGEVLTPPRSLCQKCHSTDMEFTEFKGIGRLLTYSIVHVASSAFQSLAPYTVGIVQLDEGARIPGMIRVEPKDLKIGLELKAAFDRSQSENWPRWTRYYFVRADPS
jgi:uncharacterized OB-fold protein